MRYELPVTVECYPNVLFNCVNYAVPSNNTGMSLHGEGFFCYRFVMHGGINLLYSVRLLLTLFQR